MVPALAYLRRGRGRWGSGLGFKASSFSCLESAGKAVVFFFMPPCIRGENRKLTMSESGSDLWRVVSSRSPQL